jgi:hypothetical protein
VLAITQRAPAFAGRCVWGLARSPYRPLIVFLVAPSPRTASGRSTSSIEPSDEMSLLKQRNLISLGPTRRIAGPVDAADDHRFKTSARTSPCWLRQPCDSSDAAAAPFLATDR